MNQTTKGDTAMTLAEAIDHAMSQSGALSGKCAEDHLQLARWLVELMDLRRTSELRIDELVRENNQLKKQDEHMRGIAARRYQ